MRLDCPKIGGSMLAVAPMLMQLTGSKAGWWIGFAFLVTGPLLLGVRHR